MNKIGVAGFRFNNFDVIRWKLSQMQIFISEN